MSKLTKKELIKKLEEFIDGFHLKQAITGHTIVEAERSALLHGLNQIFEGVSQKSMSKRKKIGIFGAIETVRKFNAIPLKEVDWKVYFEGKRLKECLDDFALIGLNNTDLLKSDWSARYGLKLKNYA